MQRTSWREDPETLRRVEAPQPLRTRRRPPTGVAMCCIPLLHPDPQLHPPPAMRIACQWPLSIHPLCQPLTSPDDDVCTCGRAVGLSMTSGRRRNQGPARHGPIWNKALKGPHVEQPTQPRQSHSNDKAAADEQGNALEHVCAGNATRVTEAPPTSS